MLSDTNGDNIDKKHWTLQTFQCQFISEMLYGFVFF